jgi:hypothetical protein
MPVSTDTPVGHVSPVHPPVPKTGKPPVASLQVELRAPSSELRTPSVELRAPSFELGAPSSELRTPSVELRAPSFELRAPSFELRAPSFELRAPSFELRTPSVEIPWRSEGVRKTEKSQRNQPPPHPEGSRWNWWRAPLPIPPPQTIVSRVETQPFPHAPAWI